MRIVFCLLFLTRTVQAAEPIFSLLDDTPAVAKVEYPVKGSRTLIHIRDWHWVPYDYIEAELPDDTPSEKVAAAYVTHLEEVRQVQEEQFTVLKKLLDRESIALFREGLTPDIQPAYRTVSQVLWKRHSRIPEVGDELFKRPNVLSLGTPGRLLARGLVKQVHAVDTDETLSLTNPLLPDGTLRKVPSDAIEKREDHMVRRVLQTGGNAVVILGGAHDLSDNVSRLGNGRLGLITVTTRAYRKHAGQ